MAEISTETDTTLTQEDTNKMVEESFQKNNHEEDKTLEQVKDITAVEVIPPMGKIPRKEIPIDKKSSHKKKQIFGRR